MHEVFRRDGSYLETDGANEGDVGTYYFSGNQFCIKRFHRTPDRCRSVLIDSRKRTWLITEGENVRFDLVRISFF